MYRVQLQQFEGPLDLLLFFIRRDEIDIHDIPVARIADEYLAYVRVMEEIDLDGVADFIYMAAVLIGIKAKMLLPRPELDEDGEPVDPRAELVQRLLEYVRYKEAAAHLEARLEARDLRFTRGRASAPETPTEEPVYRVSVFDLIAALKRVLDRAPAEVAVHPVRTPEYSTEQQQAYLLERVRGEAAVPFEALVAGRPRAFVVATFLALLELVQLRTLRLLLGPDPDSFRVVRADRPPAPPRSQPADPVRTDAV